MSKTSPKAFQLFTAESGLKASPILKRLFQPILRPQNLFLSQRRDPNPLAREPEFRKFHCNSVQFGLVNVPIRRFSWAKRPHFCMLLFPVLQRGIQGGKWPQSTPVRGPLKGLIKDFPKAFSFKIVRDERRIYSSNSQLCFCLDCSYLFKRIESSCSFATV